MQAILGLAGIGRGRAASTLLFFLVWPGLLILAGPTPGEARSWRAAGSMATARGDHTATLLPNGQVLVAGGDDGGAFNSAELYNPVTNSWTATGSLLAARTYHTATLLTSGKVLVAGGETGGLYGQAMSSAEIYDPATGIWSATGPMTAARCYHTATLLPNGQVLLAGGYGTSGVLTSAELYNPVTNSWTATGSLITARQYHTATLTLGLVLVSGGSVGGNPAAQPLASEELYDPAAGTWSVTENMSVARGGHTATRMGNEVLLAGGGGISGGLLNSADIYNAVFKKCAGTGAMATGRMLHTATLLTSGKVLVAGGGFGVTFLASAELFDPAKGAWTATGSLATGRYAHTATLLPNGKVLVAGGFGGTAPYVLASAELYREWPPLPPLELLLMD